VGVQPLECRSCVAVCLINPCQGTFEHANLALLTALVHANRACMAKQAWMASCACTHVIAHNARAATHHVDRCGRCRLAFHQERPGPAALARTHHLLANPQRHCHTPAHMYTTAKRFNARGESPSLCASPASILSPWSKPQHKEDILVGFQQTSLSPVGAIHSSSLAIKHRTFLIQEQWRICHNSGYFNP